MKSPAVSFIVPCYNAARYIPEFCESILAQTFSDFEVLIGDDGSTDNTVEVFQPYLRDPRFKLIRWKPNRGMHHGVTLLLNSACGEYWCPPGSDDILEPTFLERRVPKLAARPEAVLIHGPAHWIDEHGQPYRTDATQHGLPEVARRMPESMTADRMLRVLLQHNILNWPSTLVRMDLTRHVLPYYAPHWAWAMDWVIWILLAATGYDFLWDPEPMISYRMHSQSLSGSQKKRDIRRIERKLAPFYALRTASLFSPVAKTIWLEQRKALYRWWLVTAGMLGCKGALPRREMSFAAEAYRGVPPVFANLWLDLVTHGLPTVFQYRREKTAHRRQLFEVSGLSLMDDPIFRKP